LVAPNEEMAKSVSGKIEWLASFGSLLRLDAISLGIFPEQQESAIITHLAEKGYQRVKKIRKGAIREREAKIQRYSKQKGEKIKRESKEKKRAREYLLDKHSRPKGQRKRKERR
jgi:hypothetical protein